MQQPTIHHYFAKVAVPGSASDSIPSTPKAGALNLKPLSSELSEALDLMIQLARRLAHHPSMLNSISLVLRYGWNDDNAGSTIPLNTIATPQELLRGRQIVDGPWPLIYADETSPEVHGWHLHTPTFDDKIFINITVGTIFFFQHLSLADHDRCCVSTESAGSGDSATGI